MKSLGIVLCVAALAGAYRYTVHHFGHSGCEADACCPGDVSFAEPPEFVVAEGAALPGGRYVEVRDAAVFAGACHTNGESELQGRSALLFWVVERGSWDGVDLAGLEVAAAVGSEANLARDGGRSSVLFVSPDEGDERTAAARAWLEHTAADSLGAVIGIERVALAAELSGDAFSFRVPDVLEVSGTALADRSCCTMPESVWYEPVAPVTGAVVGNCDACSFEGGGELVAWAYPNENNAFVARFGDDSPAPSAPKGCGTECADACDSAALEE